MYRYTAEEYSQYFVDNSLSAWTKEETDTLFDMCEQFELRWLVIADRWENTPRTTEVRI